jgi:hypothetical protein
LFPLIPLVACRRYEPREHPRPLALARPELPPSPLSDRVGYSDHVRFRGYFPVHCIPAYNLPVYASQWPLPEHHARLGTRLLARLYRGRHLKRQSSTRFQGATLIGRVEGWRAGVARGPDPHHVSSPLHVARNVRISRIARPHLLHAKAYGTYPAGATFGPSRRTR